MLILNKGDMEVLFVVAIGFLVAAALIAALIRIAVHDDTDADTN